MSTEKRVNIGMIGAGWWANTMHMPALAACDQANVVAVCDLIPKRAEALAKKYHIPHIFTDYKELLVSGLCEAVVVATTNDTHYPITMDALNRGLHAICEKPLALNYAQASEMAATAQKKGLITCVPFTYRYMPSTRYLKHLIDEGYLGQPYHLHMRYYAAFARDPGTYLWRFERKIAGSGALADIGSHFLHLAEWFYGEIEAVCAQLSALVKRPPNPQGQSYEQADDTAMVMLRFKNGAQGLVHASAIAYERTYEDKGYGFDQVHEWDFHGSGGTLRQVIDWDFRQRITGDRPGDGPERELIVPDRFWGDARHDRVIETWEDVFRKQGFMVCEFVRAVANKQPMVPNFGDGARVQQLLDAAIESAETGCWVKTEPRSIKPQIDQTDGILRPVDITPQKAGWQYVSFAVYQLTRGQTLRGAAHGRETAVVVLSGTGKADINGQSVGQIGERLSVFEDKPAYALYLSEDASYQVECTSDSMEIAVASAPTTHRHLPVRVIRPEDVGVELRGEGNTQRRVQHILDTDQEAERLIVVEVITSAGNWSTFPPHKHDTENPPNEAYLEETYYHHIAPNDGFAFQRVYNYQDFDETVTVHDGDLVLVPKGYHVVSAAPGCDLYYLNIMAGPHRVWNYQVDPAFRRLLPPSGKITGSIVRPSAKGAD